MGESCCYNIHGARVVSNCPLPGLVSGAMGTPELRLRIDPLEDLRRRYPHLPGLNPAAPLDQGNGFHRPPQTDRQILYFWGGATYRLVVLFGAGGDYLELGWWDAENPGVTGLERIATTYLLGNLVAFALRLAGLSVLHGNAARIGQRSIAWLGPKGAGKSTLGAAFVDAGYPLITDDQVVVRPRGETFWPAPGIPRIRLWPTSLEGMTDTALAAFQQPFGDNIKGWLEPPPPAEGDPTGEPPGLMALYVLEPRAAGATTLAMHPLPPNQRLQALLHHRLARTSLPLTFAQQAAEFAALGRLAARVPVYSLRLPDRLAALPEVVRQLAATVSQIAA